MQQSCVLVKPDGVSKGLVGKILDRLSAADLQLVGLKLVRLTPADANVFYAEHQGKAFFEGLILYMTSAPIVASAWQGKEAITTIRQLVGATDPKKAQPGTIRADYGTDGRYNVIHASDSIASAQRELAFFFTPEQLLQYEPNDWEKN